MIINDNDNTVTSEPSDLHLDERDSAVQRDGENTNTNAHIEGVDACEQHTELVEKCFIRAEYGDVSTSANEDRIQFFHDTQHKKRPLYSNPVSEVNPKRSKINEAAVITRTDTPTDAVMANSVNPIRALDQEQVIGNTDEYPNTHSNSNSNTVPISFEHSDLHLHEQDVVIQYYGGQRLRNISTQGSETYTEFIDNPSTRARYNDSKNRKQFVISHVIDHLLNEGRHFYINKGDHYELIDLADAKIKDNFAVRVARQIRDINKRLRPSTRTQLEEENTPEANIGSRSHLIATPVPTKARNRASKDELSRMRRKIECDGNSFSDVKLVELIDNYPKEFAFSLFLCTLRFRVHSEVLMNKIFQAIKNFHVYEDKEKTIDTVLGEALILLVDESDDCQATAQSVNLEAINLVKQHYPESILYVDADGSTPLVRACEVPNMEILRCFIDWHLEVKPQDRGGLYNIETSDDPPIYTLIDTHRNIVSLLQWLADKGLLTSNDVKYWDLIHRLAQKSPCETIEFLVNLFPSEVMSKDNDGNLPISYFLVERVGGRNSFSDEDYAITKLLIAKGIKNGGADTIGGLFYRDPDDEESCTLDALLKKVGEGNHEKVWVMIDACIKEATDGVIVHALIINWEHISAPLREYVMNQYVVMGKGTDIMSILHTLIDTNRNIVPLLQWLSNKGLLTSKDVKDWDLIHRSAEKSPCETIKLLVNLCPSGVMSIDNDGNLPIHLHLKMRNIFVEDPAMITSDEDRDIITKFLITKSIQVGGIVGINTIGGLFHKVPNEGLFYQVQQDDVSSCTLDALLKEEGEENHERLWGIIDECINEATGGDYTRAPIIHALILKWEHISASLREYVIKRYGTKKSNRDGDLPLRFAIRKRAKWDGRVIRLFKENLYELDPDNANSQLPLLPFAASRENPDVRLLFEITRQSPCSFPD